MIGLFESTGVAFGDDARAMTEEQLAAYQAKNMRGMQNAVYDLKWIQGTAQYNPYPDKRTLDERFADFKVRLAAALERNEKRKSEL